MGRSQVRRCVERDIVPDDEHVRPVPGSSSIAPCSSQPMTRATTPRTIVAAAASRLLDWPSDKQRESLIRYTKLSKGLQKKIQQAGSGNQTLGFTRDELDELASEVDLALVEARTPHKQRLAAVFDKLAAILDALDLDDSDEPDRHSRTTGS
jgi:hypothetical protein